MQKAAFAEGVVDGERQLLVMRDLGDLRMKRVDDDDADRAIKWQGSRKQRG
jgi:hypothetical protein